MSVIDTTTATRFERRKRHTHEQIKNATSTLMLRDGYRSLSVQKITALADIGYGTFYLHYADIDDAAWDVVLEVMMTENLRINQCIMETPQEHREFEGWRLLFEYLVEHRKQYLELFGSQGSAELRRRYQAYMTQVYETGMRAQIYNTRIDLPVEFMTQFMAGATLQLLLWWLETPNPYTPEEMAAMLYRMVYRTELPPPQG